MNSDAVAPAAEASDPVVATYSGGQLTASEVEEAAKSTLIELNQQLYDAKVNAAQAEIYNRLVDQKAAGEGVSRDEYLAKHVYGNVAEPSDDEVQKIFNQYRTRLPKDEEQARSQVLNFLRGQARQQQELAFRDALFAEAGVKILLDPPRVKAEMTDHSPSRGSADAPITIVEYTDFQCPYCGRAQVTIDEVMQRYNGLVRHVFKQLPLPMHQQAQIAAEASLCAQDQGKFWELHDWMFDNRNTLDRDTLVAQAAEHGLDVEAFSACVDGKTHAAAVQADMDEARSFGITGTPGFLVNGRLIKGAQPVESFVTIIDDELRRAGLPVPKAEEKEDPNPLPDADDPREAPRATE